MMSLTDGAMLVTIVNAIHLVEDKGHVVPVDLLIVRLGREMMKKEKLAFSIAIACHCVEKEREREREKRGSRDENIMTTHIGEFLCLLDLVVHKLHVLVQVFLR